MFYFPIGEPQLGIRHQKNGAGVGGWLMENLDDAGATSSKG